VGALEREGNRGKIAATREGRAMESVHIPGEKKKEKGKPRRIPVPKIPAKPYSPDQKTTSLSPDKHG